MTFLVIVDNDNCREASQLLRTSLPPDFFPQSKHKEGVKLSLSRPSGEGTQTKLFLAHVSALWEMNLRQYTTHFVEHFLEKVREKLICHYWLTGRSQTDLYMPAHGGISRRQGLRRTETWPTGNWSLAQIAGWKQMKLSASISTPVRADTWSS